MHPHVSNADTSHIDELSDDGAIILSSADFPDAAVRMIMKQKYGRIRSRPLMKKDIYILWLTFLTTISMASEEAIHEHSSDLRDIILDLTSQWRTDHERMDYRRVRHRNGLQSFLPLLIELLTNLLEILALTDTPSHSDIPDMIYAWKSLVGLHSDRV